MTPQTLAILVTVYGALCMAFGALCARRAK